MPKHLVTSDDVQRFKPDPDPYLKGAELLKVAPADCLVVEDAPAGIRAGKASGASVLALRTTEVDLLLSAAGADWIVNDLASVKLAPLSGNHYLGFFFDDESR
jgi:beta-phosphoglucomutase-like phosphatase (HAD superfamily)